MPDGPSRLVRANQIISSALPPVRISVASAFTYVGGPRLQLYGIAHAEQHLFVVTDAQQAVRQFLWVQFEGFLPDNQRSYRYPVTQTVKLDDRLFIYDTFVFPIEREVARRPDSDLAAAYTFLGDAGYHLTGEVRAQRFVHLIGTDKRNELMVIYGESNDAADREQSEAVQDQAMAHFSLQFLAPQ